MAPIRSLQYLQSRRLWLLLGILGSFAISTTWFHRNYHFYFDAHHRYDDANFFHWCAGWFGGFDEGPLEATLYHCPKSSRRWKPFDHHAYQWHVRRVFSGAKPTRFIHDREGMTIALTELPIQNAVLVFGWYKEEVEKIDREVTPFHRSNRLDGPVATSERVGSIDVPYHSLIAWQPNKIETRSNTSRSPFWLGWKITPLNSESPRNWAIRVRTEAREDDHGFTGEFFVGFDHEEGHWRLYDRDWSSWENTNSWITDS